MSGLTCSCGATCADVERLEAENALLEARLAVLQGAVEPGGSDGRGATIDLTYAAGAYDALMG
tara:strand:- start:208 stop:396 length:189 start_codon:yes stop_codon:yes gene_type:complete